MSDQQRTFHKPSLSAADRNTHRKLCTESAHVNMPQLESARPLSTPPSTFPSLSLSLSVFSLSLSVLVMEALLVVDCGAAQQAEADGEFSRSTTDKSLSHFPDLTVTFVFSSEFFFFFFSTACPNVCGCVCAV